MVTCTPSIPSVALIPVIAPARTFPAIPSSVHVALTLVVPEEEMIASKSVVNVQVSDKRVVPFGMIVPCAPVNLT